MHHVMIGGNFNARYQGFLTPLWLWWSRVCQGLLMVLCLNLLSHEYTIRTDDLKLNQNELTGTVLSELGSNKKLRKFYLFVCATEV